MASILYYAWKETIRRKRRSFWSITGYMVSVVFFICVLTISGHSQTQVESTLRFTGAQFIGFIIASDKEDDSPLPVDAEHEGFYVYNNPTTLFPYKLIDKINQSQNVRDAAAFLSFRIRPYPESLRTWILAGFDPANTEAVRSVSCSATDIVSGRLLIPGDANHIMLEETFAASENLKTGDFLTISGQDFEIVGIMSPGTRPARGDIYMPLEQATQLINARLTKPITGMVNVVLSTEHHLKITQELWQM